MFTNLQSVDTEDSSWFLKESRMHIFSKGRYEEWNCIAFRKKKVSLSWSWLFLGGKIGDRLLWMQNVMEDLWEVDPEKRVLCIAETG